MDLIANAVSVRERVRNVGKHMLGRKQCQVMCYLVQHCYYMSTYFLAYVDADLGMESTAGGGRRLQRWRMKVSVVIIGVQHRPIHYIL